MHNIFSILQIIVSVALITAILLQQRGGGLSSVFGGTNDIYRAKRGLEKIIFISTIILSSAFLALGFIQLFI